MYLHRLLAVIYHSLTSSETRPTIKQFQKDLCDNQSICLGTSSQILLRPGERHVDRALADCISTTQTQSMSYSITKLKPYKARDFGYTYNRNVLMKWLLFSLKLYNMCIAASYFPDCGKSISVASVIKNSFEQTDPRTIDQRDFYIFLVI